MYKYICRYKTHEKYEVYCSYFNSLIFVLLIYLLIIHNQCNISTDKNINHLRQLCKTIIHIHCYKFDTIALPSVP